MITFACQHDDWLLAIRVTSPKFMETQCRLCQFGRFNPYHH